MLTPQTDPPGRAGLGIPPGLPQDPSRGTEIQIGENGTVTGLVRLAGVIGADGTATVDDTVTDLRKAFKDERTKAIILSINSPGGSPVQSSNLNQEIKEL